MRRCGCTSESETADPGREWQATKRRRDRSERYTPERDNCCGGVVPATQREDGRPHLPLLTLAGGCTHGVVWGRVVHAPLVNQGRYETLLQLSPSHPVFQEPASERRSVHNRQFSSSAHVVCTTVIAELNHYQLCHGLSFSSYLATLEHPLRAIYLCGFDSRLI